ncbi:hypothetical protein Tcan_10942 [Toxocara canis]|uniref:Uncharacterized protein n=1 Tax=Toxocara canis TaxID=6265 RepID=A0A0B2V6Z0_TOXCA|nr:hypothetical protein Tcan_10942 [Toxocara canis]
MHHSLNQLGSAISGGGTLVANPDKDATLARPQKISSQTVDLLARPACNPSVDYASDMSPLPSEFDRRDRQLHHGRATEWG